MSSGVLEGALQLALLAIALALFFQGLRNVSPVGLLAAGSLFCVASVAIWVRWHSTVHGRPFVLAEFFLLMAAVGSFQVGLAVQGLADGYICAMADSGKRIASTSLYLLLLAPDVDPISRSERPVRFTFEVASRLLIGVGLAFFLTVLTLFG